MSQNRSTAVMQRRVAGTNGLDFYPTPPWATRALVEFIVKEIGNVETLSAWEPACGQGHMAAALKEFFASVRASDVHGYGYGEVLDFLFPGEIDAPNWVITNPPFRLAEQFISQALSHATIGVAMLVRCAFLEGIGRYERLFSRTPPAYVLQFTERVVMHHGVLSQHGSTATAYAWVVWRKGVEDTLFGWIPPCRKRLERDADYAGAPCR